ncbi:STAS/SEC14 domain-containing protein [Planococcus sp. CPCC 101016]|uniref:STAS/SEC14 domain-containing protein n=1 Tax=Planococcus sp. CPCC 101016 TaxID=2599617 RepID=UPI0011B3D0E8|nr:STAS/SEC14 domain-containing protein [Planococcus sp. CPCC 101016]TWT04425.1 STAS/SEC14 domain-containing protein [Planococcus sp. CPCC 101016]
MLSFVPSKDTETIAIEFEGAATKEDALKIDKIIQDKFADKGKFNIYAVINEVEGSAFTGLGESMQVNMEAWNQFHKFAVISSSYLEGQLAEMENMLPHLEVKHFQMDEMIEAWEWIQE